MARETASPVCTPTKSLVSDLVSVVVVSWNHAQYLPQCLAAISNQTYPKIDITVVDNASQDGSAEWVLKNCSHVHLIRLGTNSGFSHAFNLGARLSQGEFVLSLNPDVTSRPGFVANMVSALKRDAKIGSVAPKLLRADDPGKLDSTGLFLNRQRRPYDRGQLEPDTGQFDACREIFGACGAAALYRRSMLDDLAWQGEYLDEDFFAYYEDADIAWRARLMGWRSVFAPEAVADHVRGWGDTLRKNSSPNNLLGPKLAFRNRYLMLVKNETLPGFWLDSPWIMFPDILRIIYFALFRPELLAAIGDFFRLRSRARQKRAVIQNRRLIGYEEIRQWFGKLGARH